MTQFEFFFALYGLLLGLAAAELLQGVASVVRARQVKRIGLQTGLLAVLLLFLIVATWLDAWSTRDRVDLSFAGLLAPIGVAVAYYLAAVMAFPRDIEAWDTLDAYFEQRKRWIVGLLLAAETIITFVMYLPSWEKAVAEGNTGMIAWLVVYNLAIFCTFAWLFFARTPRGNILALGVLIAIFLLPYWNLDRLGDDRRTGPDAPATAPAKSAP